LVVVATLVAFVAVVAEVAELTTSVFASTTVGASADPLGCQTGTNVCPVVHDAGCTLLVTVVADAATLRPYCVMPERPLAVRYVFVSRENVPAAVIFTNGVPDTHVG
jgi:hypothetical protein